VLSGATALAVTAGSFLGSVALAPAAAAAIQTPVLDLGNTQRLAQPFVLDEHALYGGSGEQFFSYPMSEAGPGGVVNGRRANAISTQTPRLGAGSMNTVAIDGGGPDGERTPRIYGWHWGAPGTSNRPAGSPTPANQYIPVAGYDEGSTTGQVHYIPIPSALSGLSTSYNYWSGGEVYEQTGEIYVAPGECAGINNSGRLGIYDPQTGTSRGSARLVPQTPADNIFGSSDGCTTNGKIASDMAIDALGNAYMLVRQAANATFLVRIVPGEHRQPWEYNVVGRVLSSTGGNHSTGNYVYGMAFVNGQLYYQVSSGNGIVRIDPISLRVQQTVSDSATGYDLASAQTAPVLAGTVFDDANGNGVLDEGEVGLAGQTIALYDDAGTLLGTRETGGAGDYSFILNSTDATFHVRLVQPQVNGVNAVQTYAAATSSGPVNRVTALCSDGSITDGAGACSGQVPMPAPDPSLGDVGSVADLSAMPILTTVVVGTGHEVSDADFGVHAPATGSWGDSGVTTTRAQEGPRLHEPDGDLLRLGDTRDASTDGASDDSHATDDGVAIAGPRGPIALAGGGTVLAVGAEYDLIGALRGEGAENARMSAWLAATNAPSDFRTGSTATSGEAGTAREQYRYAGADDALAPLTVPSTDPAGGLSATWLRAVALDGSTLITEPDNRSGAYQPAPGSAAANTQHWVNRGEVEDHRVHVANAVVRVAAATTGKVADAAFDFALEGPVSSTAPSATTSSVRPTAADTLTYSGTSHALSAVGQDVGVALDGAPAGWAVEDLRVVDTLTGAEVPGATVDVTTGAVTVPGSALPRGADVTVEYTFEAGADPDASTWTFDIASVIADGVETAVATVTVVDGAGEPKPGAVVTFSAPAGVHVSEVVDNGDGTYTATFLSTVAQEAEIRAFVGVAGQPTELPDSPQTAVFLAGPPVVIGETRSVVSIDDDDPRTADDADAHVVTVVLLDEYGNIVTGAADALGGSGHERVTVHPFTETEAPGVYVADVTSTLAGSHAVTITHGDDLVIGTVVAVYAAGSAAGEGWSSVTIDDQDPRTADGSHTHLVTVTLVDAHGNGVDGAGSLLAGSGPEGLDVGRFAPTGAAGIYTAMVSSTVAGDLPVTVTHDGDLVIGTVIAVFAPGAPDLREGASALTAATTGDRTVADPAGVSPDSAAHVHTAEVTVVDAFGNRVPGVDVTFGRDDDALAPLGGTVVTTGADGVARLHLTAAVAGTYTVTATVARAAVLPAEGVTFTFVADEPVVGPGGSSIAAAAGEVEADGIAAHWVEVTAVDRFGNPVAGAQVDLDLPAELVVTDGAPSGTTGVDGTYRVLVASTVAGTHEVTATLGGSPVTEGSPASVTFTSGAPSAARSQWTVDPAGAQPVGAEFTATVRLADAHGNAVGAGHAVELTVPAEVQVLAEAPYLTDDAGRVTVRMTSTTVGGHVVSAAVGADRIGEPRTLEFVADAPDLGVDGVSRLTATGGDRAADGVDTHTVTATLADRFGNPVTGTEVTFAPADGLVAVGATTVATDGTGVATLDVVSTRAGTHDVTATVDGTPLLNGAPATVTFVAGAVDVERSSFTVDPEGPLTAGTGPESDFTGTVVLRDAHDNPVPGASVQVRADPATDRVPGVATSDADGVATATIGSSTALTATLSAAVVSGGTELTLPGVQRTWTAGAPDLSEDGGSVLAATPGEVPADGTATHTVTATLRDAHGNPVTGAEVAFELPAGLDVAGGGPAIVATDDDGVAALDVSSLVAATFPVEATVAGEPVRRGSPAEVRFTPLDVSAAGSTLAVAPEGPLTVGRDEAGTYTVTVVTQDRNGNAVPGSAVTLEVRDADGEVVTEPLLTDAHLTSADGGIATTTLTSTLAGTFTVHALIDGEPVPGSGTEVTWTAGAASVENSELTVTPGEVEADGAAAHGATATVRDAFGNPVAGVEVGFDAEHPVQVGDPVLATDADGVATSQKTSTRAGTYAVTAQVEGLDLPGSGATITFVSGAASAATSSWTVTPGTAQPAGADFTAEVTVRDATGNAVEGAEIGLDLPDDVTARESGPYLSDADGTVVVRLTAERAGEYPVAVALGADQVGDVETLVFVAGDVSLETSTVDATTPVEANGIDASVVVVTLRDAFGNVVTAPHDVVVTSTLGTVGSPSTRSGDVAARVTSLTAGEATVSFTVDGAQAADSATVLFVATPATPVVDPSNGTSVTGQVQPGAAVEVTDADGDPILGTATVRPDGTFVFTPDVPLEDGALVVVVAVDEHGFTSDPAAVVVDATPPPAPVVPPTQGDKVEVEGVEEGATPSIRDPETGAEIPGEWEDNGDGSWTFTPETPLEEGDAAEVVVTDPAGNESEATPVVVDTTPPPAPVVPPTQGDKVEVEGVEEGATPSIRDPGSGELIPGTWEDNGEGSWTFTPDTPLEEGAAAEVVVTDPAGNESESTPVVVDTTPPPAPVVPPTQGDKVEVEGVEEGATPSIRDPETGAEIPGEWQDNGDGSWTFTPETPLEEGDAAEVVVTDPAGNESDATVVDIDTTAPDAPTLNPSNGTRVVGVAEPGSLVTLTGPDGLLCTVRADEVSGAFDCAFDPALEHGTEVTAVATDAAGNVSGPATVVVDATVPGAPVLDPSNGSTVSGTAEPGSTVVLTLEPSGEEIARVVADERGEFTVPFVPALEHDTVIGAVSVTEAGNTGPQSLVTVDSVAPPAPVVPPTQGVVVDVEGVEEGATPSIRDPETGAEVPGTWEDNGDGSWTFTPETPLTEEDAVEVVVTDPAGNESDPVAVVVDTTPPAAPVVPPSAGDKVEVEGVEEGATPSIRDPETGTEVPGTWEDRGDGSWTFTPDVPLTEEDSVEVVVTDPAGNESEPTPVVVDTTPPPAPVVPPTQGVVVEVEGVEEGSTPSIRDPETGELVPGTWEDRGDGSWTFTPDVPLTEEDSVEVVVTDPAGNESEPTPVVVDTTPPPAPVVPPTQGVVVEVEGVEEGSTPSIRDPETGIEVPGTWEDQGEGSWTFTPDTPLTEEDAVEVVVTDPAGNESDATPVVVDTTPPPAPVVPPTQGVVVEVEGVEEGATPSIRDPETGTEIPGAWEDKGDGSWVFTPDTPLVEGDAVEVVVTDPAGNESEATPVVVDTTPPPAPVVPPTPGDKVEVEGVEEGATPSIRDPETGAEVPGTWEDKGDGSWVFTPDTPLEEGAAVEVVVTDPAGNESDATPVVVDSTPPPAPVVPPTQGVVVEVEGVEEGATPSIRDPETGAEVPGEWQDNGNGSWTFTPDVPLTEEDAVEVVVTDPAGNESDATPVVVDTTPPPAPVVPPTQGVVVEVEGVEEGSTPSIRDPETGELVPGTWEDRGDGSWTFTPDVPLTEEDAVEVVVTDPAGNESDATPVVVDTTPPAAPVVPPSTGETIEVEGVEEGSTPSIRDPETGELIPGTWEDKGDGSWVFTPDTPLEDGAAAEVVVTDPAGNVSDPTPVVVAVPAPPTPEVAPVAPEAGPDAPEPGSDPEQQPAGDGVLAATGAQVAIGLALVLVLLGAGWLLLAARRRRTEDAR